MSTSDFVETGTAGAVVVGVTGPGRETAALRFAVAVARREELEVVLVHAFRTALPAPPQAALVSYAATADVAEWVVKEVEEELAGLTGGRVRFRSITVAGAPARVLADLSRGARVVVLQHRTDHAAGRLFTGSTVTGTATHAHCPVVSVPADWEAPVGDEPGEVVVGVHEGGLPRPVLAAAYDWAEATAADLRVVHAWRLDPAYDDIITARVAGEWNHTRREALAAAVTALGAAHPGVRVTLEVRHQYPPEVLVEESRSASLVVLGRRGPHLWPGEHLGSLARTVLRAAHGPVMVVPVARHDESPRDWDLLADEVSPQA
ncbi:universal stress protein [Nocardioides sp. J2M5]|uniref:universal stress protein n=1 Tax=Nocardioides palaemonis TaxID=2829810 RepID=UPI001BAD0908|nr:universal stress protein [Nocardioides palaemonis]MBS2937867.1 universal stress protein [Nocardioides palaemonis]